MTGQLRSTLDARADQLDTWEVDLDAIVWQGDRRVRRRRTALAGGLAGFLAVACGVTALLGHAHRTTPPADQDAKPLTYAVGSVIHDGAVQVDVGMPVWSLVPTARGFVFSGPAGKVYEEKDGQVRQIGHLADNSTPLTVSDDGLVAAWWDGASIQTWPGLGGNTDSFSVADSWSPIEAPRVLAMSTGHLWYWDGGSTKVAEIHPISSTAVWDDPAFAAPTTIQSAAGDQVLIRIGDGMAVTTANLRPADDQGTWNPGTDLSGVDAQVPDVPTGDLAPDGKHWFSEDSHELTVYDSATGKAQTFDHPGGYPSAMPYLWLGNDTIAAVAIEPNIDGSAITPVSLLVCHVSTGTCAVAEKDAGSESNLVVADGRASLP